MAILPHLRRDADVLVVTSAGGRSAGVDLDLYHVADDPAHGFVHRALRERPGLVLLADWALRRLVRSETAGEAGGFVAAARRAHGDTGDFVARQVQRGLGGEELPSLLVLNDRVLEASLGLVAFTEAVRARAALRLPGRPVVHLPLGFVGLPRDLPVREAAREALGLPPGAILVAVVGSLDVGAGRALASVRAAEAGLRARAWPDDEAASRQLLAAADLAIALDGPSGNGPPAPVFRAVAAGIPTIVSAGSSAAAELPDGVVVTVSPGPTGPAEIEALLLRLVRDERLRGRVRALALAHAEARRDPGPHASQLLVLVRDLLARDRPAPDAPGARGEEATPLGWALDELRGAAAGLGLEDLPPGIERLLSPLLPGPP
jgi:hypothetical protein